MKKNLLDFLKFGLSLMAFFAFGFAVNAQSTIVSQSFEGTGTWNYSTNPATYNVSDDIWDVVGNIAGISPTDGTLFFGMRDLDNGNGGGPFAHRLIFEDIDITGFNNVQIMFDYNVFEFDSTDYIQYIVVADGVEQTPVLIDNDGSGTIDINVSAIYSSAEDIGLIIEAEQNGGGDYAGVDNFKITGNQLSTNDLTSTVNAPTNQVSGTTVNADTFTTQANAVEVFSFEIEDAGSGDNLPTLVTAMRFTEGVNNTLLWAVDVEGLRLSDGGSTFYTPSSIDVQNDEVTLNFDTPISIADGTSQEFTVLVYIKETGIADGDVIQLKIDDTGSGFTSDPNGSGIESTLSNGSIIGNLITINVEATKLTFKQQPTDVNANVVMSPSVRIAFTDINGNVDTAYSGANSTVNIATNGSFHPSASVARSATDGIAIFNNIIFDNEQSGVTITATHGDGIILGNYVSNMFDVTLTPVVIVVQDFDSTMPEWNYINNVAFFDNGTDGFYGPNDIGSSPGVDNPDFMDNILYEVDLDDEGENGTAGFATITFQPINITAYEDVQLSFDYDIEGYNANDDDAKYEVFYDGVSQGEIFLLDGNGAAEDAEGKITVNIPNNVNEVNLSVSIRNNGGDGYSGFDNFQLAGIPNTTEIYVFQSGIWTPSNPEGGISDSNDDIMIIDGIAVFNDVVDINNLTINTNATLRVRNLLNLNGDLTNDGDLVFASLNETNTGLLGKVPESSTISGNPVVVERFIPAGRAFRFLSSSLTTATSINANWQEGVNNTGTDFPADNMDPDTGFGIHITGSTNGANGFDATVSGSPSMFMFDNVSGDWETVENTDVNILQAGTPYRVFVRGDRSIDVTDNQATPTNTRLRTTGSLVTGTVEMNNMSDVAGGFNFIGNPYQATVNMIGVVENSTNINENQYYIWDPNLGTRGAYATISLDDGTNAQGSAANIFLQPGQAAFVTTENTVNGTSVVFEEEFKSTPSQLTETFRSSNSTSLSDLNIIGKLYTQDAFANGNGLSDGFRVRFSDNYSNDFELNDAVKPFNIDENMGVMNADKLLSIERRALPTAEEIIPIYNNNYRTENYILSLEVAAFENVNVYLEDTYTQDLTLLESGVNNIPFSVSLDDESSSDARFFLRFTEDNLKVDNLKTAELVVYPNPLNNESLFIQFSKQTQLDNVKVSAYNVLGQRVYQNVFENSNDATLEIKGSNSWESGVYIVSIENGSNTITKKIVKK